MSADHYWLGKSGTFYPFWLLNDCRPFAIKSEAGVYMFVKPVPIGTWWPVYIGIAEDLSTRLPWHERWAEAADAGATRVMAHTMGSTVAREAEERDLVQLWNPVLNTHHRSIGNGLLAGILAQRRGLL